MKRKTSTMIFESLIDIFAGILLWPLIWAGAVIALAEAGELPLAILLTLSGGAWIYREEMRRRDIKKGSRKNVK